VYVEGSIEDAAAALVAKGRKANRLLNAS
jgi:hypothetical protein